MSEISTRLREFVNDPSVSDHYGGWGALRPDQRRQIRELCDVCDGYERAADNAMFALEKRKWIPVTDRFPEDDVQVLVVVLGDVELGRYDSKRSLWNTIANVWNDGEVSHWMPLPEPPERSDAE